MRKFELLTGKDILSEKYLLEKAAAIKKYEYSLLGSELKKQTSVAENQHQGLNKLFKSDEKEELVTIKKEKPVITYESKLMYDSKYKFSYFSNIRKNQALPFTSECNKLVLKIKINLQI